MKKTYYLFNPGRMERKDNTLKFMATGENGKPGKTTYLPIENIAELYVFGSVDANSAMYNFLGKNSVSVHFYDYYENYTGSFMPKDGLLSGKTQVAQVQHYLNPKKRMAIARKIIEGAAHNMVKNLKYYNNRGKALDEIIELMQQYKSGIGEAENIPALMGIEGNIRKTYYAAFDLIINDFDMEGRSMRPPKNVVNALISFGNMICYSQCLRAIHLTHLNPVISFLHEPGDRRFSLSLDLAEIFKPLLVDRVIFKVLNKKIIQKKDFEAKIGRIILKESAKKDFLGAFEDRLKETIEHRSLKKQVSYKYLIQLECYKLVKHILDIEEYQPFKMWW